MCDSRYLRRGERVLESRRDILGIRFDFIGYRDVFQRIEEWRERGVRSFIVLANPHSLCLSRRYPEMRRAMADAGLVLPDGIGIIVAGRLLGYPHAGRVTGPMLVLHLCDWGRSAGYRHFFYGGRPGVAAKMAANLRKLYPGLEVVGCYSPPFRTLTDKEEPAVIERINRTRPDIVWIGLGAPKQEVWMASHSKDMRCTAMIGVGAAFDFHSGEVPWAPQWMRTLGTEWLHRLAIQPKRTWPKVLDAAKLVFEAAAVALFEKHARRGA